MRVNKGALNFPHIPGYELKKRLGKGGMGSVYLAHRKSDGKELAIKVVNESLQQVINNALKKRFLREIAVCNCFARPRLSKLTKSAKSLWKKLKDQQPYCFIWRLQYCKEVPVVESEGKLISTPAFVSSKEQSSSKRMG